MKKLLIVLSVIAAIAIGYTGLSACSNEDVNKGKEMDCQGLKHLEFLNEKIGLSDEQIHKIIKLDSDFKTKYYDNKKDKSKLDALRKEHHQQFHSILTEDQRKKLDQFKGKKGD